LIDAADDPFEAAVAEVLYSTGVRVSELINLRIEDIQWETNGSHLSSIRVHRGKGGKDRVVLFGRKAAIAIRAYQRVCPSTSGFLFESPARIGSVYCCGGRWLAKFYVDKIERCITIFPRPIGRSRADAPVPKSHSREEAKREFDRITSQIPGFHPIAARRYTPEAIRNVLHRLAHRVGLKRVHPHALRRAFASHLLQNGADLRVLQDLLGHTNVRTTMIYTSLTAENLKAVHERTHPHEQRGQENAEKERISSGARRNRSAQSR
jgi:site-specific recombinase XerC